MSISSPLTAGARISSAAHALRQLLEAVLQVEDRGIDDLELLLDPDREIGGGLEDLADDVQVEAVVLRLWIGF